MCGINSESVHLIATDPPFQKGKGFNAPRGSLSYGATFDDKWGWDEEVNGRGSKR